LDKNNLFNGIIRNSFFVSIGTLLLIFVMLNKVFIFSSYKTLEFLGIVNLNSVYEFSLVKNDMTIMKLASNEWKIEYEFNDLIDIKGSIGFHLGDIYLICKEDTKEMFMESLQYDLAKNRYMAFDNKAYITFNKDDINIIQIKLKSNNS
jgi:hypothetical protein